MTRENRAGGRGRKADSVTVAMRLPKDIVDALRAMAQAEGTVPGALVERWVLERVTRS